MQIAIHLRFTKFLLFLVFVLLSVSLATELSAQAVTVSSLSALQSAINAATPGDTIVVADGVYETTGQIPILNKNGTAEAPIVIMAQTIGGAEITGRATFNIGRSSSYIVIAGFRFTHQAQTGNYNAGSHCTFTRNYFECPVNETVGGNSSSYLKTFGSYNTISYNTFANKNYRGPVLSVQGPNNEEMGVGNHIHHNYFDNFPASPDYPNDNSAIQPGYSRDRLNDARMLIEYNLFNEMNADAEGVMSVKCYGVTFRYNTVRNCRDISLRNGKNHKVYGNYIFGGSGVRFADDNHLIYNNTFVDVETAVKIFTRLDPDRPGVYTHQKADNCYIGFNTMIGCERGTWHDGTGGSSNLRIENNLYYDCDVALTLNRTQWTDPVIKGNLVWNSPEGLLADSAYFSADPRFTFDAFGVPSLTEGSPAIDAATGELPSFIDADVQRQPRDGFADIGADEFSSALSRNEPLTVNDVGQFGALAGVVQVQIIPGIVEAEAFAGDDGVAVDTTLDVGGGRQLVGIDAGESITYSADVQGFGAFEVRYRVASVMDSVRFTLFADNVAVGSVAAAPTGGTDQYADVLDTVLLQDGAQQLRILAQSGGWSLNRITFTRVVSRIAPTVIFDQPDTVVVERGYDLEVEAFANDPDGEIANVRLFRDGELVRQESVAPYTWGHDGAPDPEEINGLSVGSYLFTAIATDNDGITETDSFRLVVELPVGATEPVWGRSVRLFPNPVTATLTVSGLPAGLSERSQVRLFDAAGRQVTTTAITYSTQKILVAVHQLPAGAYSVRIVVDGGVVTRQFVRR